MEFVKKGFGLINSKAQPLHFIGVSEGGFYSVPGHPIRVDPSDMEVFATKEEAEKFGKGYDELEVVEVCITVKLTTL